MKKLVITKGLPASGKSTWAREFVKGKKDWVRVNNDDLQLMMFGEAFAKGRGDFLDKVRMMFVDWLITKNMNIIADNTNLHPKQEVYYRSVVDEHNFKVQNGGEGELYEFSIKDFTNVPIGECLIRNRNRPGNIPDKVIYDMYNSYLKKEVPALEQDKTLPKALVVDLDGTMALMVNRSPYEMSKVYDDAVNQPIVDLVNIMKKTGHRIFFISGRDKCAEGDTIRWLADKAGITDGYSIFLRPDNDPRPDTQFKKDIFEEHLKGKYYVDFWIEDRWRMTHAVRNELGITCLQCADGHF